MIAQKLSKSPRNWRSKESLISTEEPLADRSCNDIVLTSEYELCEPNEGDNVEQVGEKY